MGSYGQYFIILDFLETHNRTSELEMDDTCKTSYRAIELGGSDIAISCLPIARFKVSMTSAVTKLVNNLKWTS